MSKVTFLFILTLLYFIPFAQEKCGTMVADSILRAKIPNAPGLDDFENWLQQRILAESANRNSRVVYVIPVVVHVIHNGDAVGSNENISQAQVYSQIDVLNEDFRRLNADTVNTPSAFESVAADIEIEFCLAQVDPNGNIMPEAGIDRVDAGQSTWSSTSDIDNNLKPATIWDPAKYFNMWTVDFGSGSLLGYAQFPEGSGLAGMPGGAQSANTDGVVMRYSAFGRIGNVSQPYHLGRTATHEVGHSFGLRHIWGDGGCGTDDYCNDTPESDASNYGCPVTHVSCGSTDMVQNFMDYSDDDCINLFTKDQRTRIRAVILNSPRRAELLNSTVCQVLDQYSVSGQVRDAQSLQGIPQAKVRLKNLSFSYTVTADPNGNFTLNNVFEGTYNLYAGKWGYVTNELQNVVVQNGMSPLIIDVNQGYYDDFILDFGWAVSGNAGTGEWERDNPLGTNFNGEEANPGEDVANDYGEDAFVTGNAGGAAGNDDVDNGNTVLTSPVFDLSSYNEPFISYYRWFYNSGGSGTPDDKLEISLTNGNATVILETLDVNTNNSNQWNYNSFRVRDYISPTANMRFIAETADDLTATGHLVEAGIDLFKITDSLVNTNTPPIAAFKAGNVGGCPGVTINFSDASFNNPVSWNWLFPGGMPSSSTLQNPAVIYNTPGTYKVTLIATNQFGSDTLVKSAYINIADIQASFNASGTQGCPGLMVDFTDQSSCNPLSWNWNFPGGIPSVSSLPNPSVIYSSVGSYDVSLIVSNGSSSDTITQANYITVNLGGAVTLLAEDFESGSFVTNGWTIENQDNDEGWEIVTVVGSNIGNKAARMHLFGYNDRGQRDKLISPELNFSGLGNATLSFEHAHRRSSTNLSDSLIIYVSTDGGLTFPERILAAAEDGSGTFATGFTTGADFIPGGEDDWCFAGGAGATCFTIDLNIYDGVPSVTLLFETYNDIGNNIYLDNIIVSGVCTSPSSPPIANFTSNRTSGCNPLLVTFNDQSINNPSGWSWSFPGGNPLSSNLKTPTVTYNTPGIYDVTLVATSAFGADTVMVNNKIEVFENPSVSTSGTDVSCFGVSDGTATALGSAGSAPYFYLWSTGVFLPNINGLSAGSYAVTITDANNCEAVSTVAINEPAALVLSTSFVPDFCGSSNGMVTANAMGGQLPYNFFWSNGQTTATIDSLTSGAYTVTVTDSNGCNAVESATITALPPLAVNLDIINAACGDKRGSINVNPLGGVPPYTYQWSNGTAGQMNGALFPGTYYVTVSDSNNCMIEDSAVIISSGNLIISLSSTPDSLNNGDGSATVNIVAGTPPYNLQWNDPDSQSTFTALNLMAGTYEITVVDDNGCEVIDSVTVDVFTSTVSLSKIPEIAIYPNPTTGKLIIEIKEAPAKDFTFQVINPIGKTIISKKAITINGKLQVDLTNLATGIYLVRVSDADNVITRKILLTTSD